MKFLRNQKGFTLIELVMVIVILGILASVAIPKFSDISKKATIAAEAGVVGAVRAGISAVYMTNLINSPGLATYPDSLDAVTQSGMNTPNESPRKNFFSGVLAQGGLEDGKWYKTYSDPNPEYVGPAFGEYTYYPDTIGVGTPTEILSGSFLQTDQLADYPGP